MIILDTNVLSEVMRAAPSARVMEWLAKESAPGVFTTTIAMAEILYGIELLTKGKRRAALASAAGAMFAEDFAGRVLPFDSDAARVFPKIAAGRRASGRPITHFDAQIAAIARSRGAAIATRNAADFEECGVTVVNPWEE